MKPKSPKIVEYSETESHLIYKLKQVNDVRNIQLQRKHSCDCQVIVSETSSKRQKTSQGSDTDSADESSVVSCPGQTSSSSSAQDNCSSTVDATAKLNGDDVTEVAPVVGSKTRSKKQQSSGGSQDSSEGESLLRPLLAKDDSPDLAPSSPVSVLSLPGVNPRKRTRRDTGSSVASDRSDLSTKSADHLTLPPAKRVKATSPGPRRKSSSVEARSESDNNKPDTKSEAKQKGTKKKQELKNG